MKKTFIITTLLILSVFSLTPNTAHAGKFKDILTDNNWIILEIPIPFPGCSNTDLKEFVKCCSDVAIKNYYTEKQSGLQQTYKAYLPICPSGSVAAVRDVPSFIMVVVQFITILIIVMMVLLLMVSGIQYITSRGNPAGAQKSIERVKHATFGLVVVLFSSVILYQVNPSLLTLSIDKPGQIDEVVDVCINYLDKTLCEGAECKWTGAPGAACVNPTSFQCDSITNKDTCISSNCDYINNICIAKRYTECSFSNTKDLCSMAIACVWEIGCNPNQKYIDEQLKTGKSPQDACQAQKNKAECDKYPSWCDWTQGCMPEKLLAARKCSDFTTQEECPTYNCYFESNKCNNAIELYNTCDINKQTQCGGRAYCAKPTEKFSSRCELKLDNDKECRMLISNNGAYEIDSYACKSGRCLTTCQ